MNKYFCGGGGGGVIISEFSSLVIAQRWQFDTGAYRSYISAALRVSRPYC